MLELALVPMLFACVGMATTYEMGVRIERARSYRRQALVSAMERVAELEAQYEPEIKSGQKTAPPSRIKLSGENTSGKSR